MIDIGYKLSSEEHGPRDLVRLAQRAEDSGFEFAVISDHYHPWVDRQGESPFVWTVIGAIAEATDRIRIGTAVTCPTIRIHPAIVAQAAATSAALLPGRFFLGLGSGENLNEHILGDPWPPADVRLDMLEEAIDVIRLLWEGGVQSHRGGHYVVENARLYSLPEEEPPLLIAAGGDRAAELAGRAGDGLIGVSPDPEILRSFDRSGGRGKPRYAEISLCWAEDEAEARRTATRWWPNVAMPGQLSQDVGTPALFEAIAELVGEDDVAEKVACGPDPEPVLETIRTYTDAGYDHVALHQIGPDQDGFFRFFEEELRPKLG
jgi:coenzyme F420-dependent glucose-6-phosphate dehydrogenase